MAEVTTTELTVKLMQLSTESSASIQRGQQTWLMAEEAVNRANQAIANLQGLGSIDPTNITASRLATARAIAVTGDASGSAVFDGSSDITITLTSAPSGVTAGSAGPESDGAASGSVSIPWLEVDSAGRVTALSNREISIEGGGGNGLLSQSQSSKAGSFHVLLAAENETGPDRQDSAIFCEAIAANPFTGALSATVFNGSLAGNASTATRASQDANGNTIDLTYMPVAGGAYTGGFFGKPVDLGTSGNYIDLDQGSVFKRTINANTSFAVRNLPAGSCACFTLILINGGSATITWFPGAKWPSGQPPVLSASGTDVITFITYGDNLWHGALSSHDSR